MKGLSLTGESSDNNGDPERFEEDDDHLSRQAPQLPRNSLFSMPILRIDSRTSELSCRSWGAIQRFFILICPCSSYAWRVSQPTRGQPLRQRWPVLGIRRWLSVWDPPRDRFHRSLTHVETCLQNISLPRLPPGTISLIDAGKIGSGSPQRVRIPGFRKKKSSPNNFRCRDFRLQIAEISGHTVWNRRMISFRT